MAHVLNPVLNRYLLVVQSVLNCANGIYFADRVVANEAAFNERLKLDKERKVS